MVAGVLAASGCATKKFVHNTVSPVQAKVDQVGEQTNKNSSSIEQTQKDLKGVDERAEAGISAAKERAMSADNRAQEAMAKAGEAGTLAASAKSMAEGNSRELSTLRNVVANIDDYRLSKEVTVHFAFGKHILSEDAKRQLDELVTGQGPAKRFVISVEGFTDRIGTDDYNAELSQKRATAVVNYLVSKHSVPIYRVHQVGLGKDKPIDDGKTADARSKNRRVEVKIFSADSSVATLNPATPKAAGE
jgi:outer membrane protein OmpA-like peptidoglycan-associated protein